MWHLNYCKIDLTRFVRMLAGIANIGEKSEVIISYFDLAINTNIAVVYFHHSTIAEGEFCTKYCRTSVNLFLNTAAFNVHEIIDVLKTQDCIETKGKRLNINCSSKT